MTDEKKDPRSLLADAIKKRDELNTFIKVLQEMVGLSDAAVPTEGGTPKPPERTPSGEAADPLSVVYPGMFFGKSQPQAAKMLLESVRRPLKTRVIVEALERGGCKVGGKKPAVNLWGILKRNEDVFILVPKAGWGLVDWYDAKVIEKMKKEGSEEGDGGKTEEKE